MTLDSRLRGNDGLRRWIAACAGMTVYAGMTETASGWTWFRPWRFAS